MYYPVDKTKDLVSVPTSLKCYIKKNCLGSEFTQKKPILKGKKLIPLSQRTKTLRDIKSPINGYVLRIFLESAKYIEAGAQLLELGNPQDLEIVVDLLSSDAVKIKPDAIMFLEDWGGDSTLQAKVRYIEPSAFTKVSALGVEEQRVNVIADFVDLNRLLGDRYRVETRTVVWSGKDVLVIPLSALFRCESGNNRNLSELWCTFVVENNQAQKREITVSERSNFEAVIDQGLEVGEKVILHPNEQIQSGSKVQIAP